MSEKQLTDMQKRLIKDVHKYDDIKLLMLENSLAARMDAEIRSQIRKATPIVISFILLGAIIASFSHLLFFVFIPAGLLFGRMLANDSEKRLKPIRENKIVVDIISAKGDETRMDLIKRDYSIDDEFVKKVLGFKS